MEQQPGGYAFSIRAVEGPHGEQFPVGSAVDPGGSGRLVPIGLVIPIVVSIPPGRMYEVRMPLRILLAIAPGDAGFESLLQQGYKVRIGYHVSRSGARLAIYKYPDLWTGDIDSAAVGYRGR